MCERRARGRGAKESAEQRGKQSKGLEGLQWPREVGDSNQSRGARMQSKKERARETEEVGKTKLWRASWAMLSLPLTCRR